jgi:hypothetical protein
MDNNNISNYDLTKVNDINTIITNENIISSSPSTINNNNNNVNNNNNYMTNNIYIDCSKKINELRLKRKKIFGNKIKLKDWGTRGLIGSKENEVDIISYLNKKKKIDRDELCMKFNINPSFQERQILESIIKKNPMINIRKRDKDYLLRIKIRKIKYNKKFKNLKQAQDLRNILLLYSMINDPKFILHLTKRNKISEANQKKNKNKKDTIEELEEDNLIFPKQISLNNYIKTDNNENGNIEDDEDDMDFNKEDNNDMIFDQI